jgi:hypothetical protein
VSELSQDAARAIIDRLGPGMKQAELRKHSTCDVCHEKVGHTGLPLFWRVTVERFGIDMRAVRRQDGLAQFIGSSAIAAAMGPDPDMAKPLMDPTAVTLCESCAMDKTGYVVAVAMERSSRAPAVEITVREPDGAELASWRRDARGRLVEDDGEPA